MRTNLFRVVAGAVVGALLAAACGSDDAVDGADAPAPDGPVPMIVDYSPTLSDVPALMFLATHPDVDLLAVTLPGTGESDCEPGVRNTRALLVIAGHADVPVACGAEEPMTGDRDWPPQFREAARTLVGVDLPAVDDTDPIDAVDLLADTLRGADQPVTIVALGPLTNLGHLFEAEPSLAAEVRSLVTMGGAFDVPGNVEDAPDAEWNLYIDPESVRVVLDSGAPVTFVPLDATNSVPGETGILARLTATATTDSGEAVRQLWAASLGTERSIAAEWWYFWDELAAVIAVEPSVATLTERSVAMEDSGATVERADGVPASVAVAADAERFEELFLETFAGGELPALELTTGERAYLDAVRAAMTELISGIDSSFVGTEAQAEQVPADELVTRLVGDVAAAMGAFGEVLTSLDDAGRMEEPHDALVEAVTTFVESKDAYLEALTAAAPPEPLGVDGFFELFFGSIETSGLGRPFDAFETACGDLELAAFGLGATDAVCPE